ncbi:hypothetical protein [Bradyrhizobium sp. WSM471]|uniref:hypothetical protein n=1 Tax=Bradyrhizobium sp. WSM471 TaxID=319017 RepID=UPI00024D22E6|nr:MULTISPECIES: hypothetical protein [Bradyrhizobium]EHR01415.1 hypothetical protein Bra471DRAFT_02142 [Bradyrhizobium sp. WSM471]UFW43473.1 hypothetical protein BcanWSM471_10515 [Bradyrhizobium canariense]
MAKEIAADKLLVEKALVSAKHALLVVRHAKLSDRRAAIKMVEQLLADASDYKESAVVPGGVDAYLAASAAIDELVQSLRSTGADSAPLWSKSIAAIETWRDVLTKTN